MTPPPTGPTLSGHVLTVDGIARGSVDVVDSRLHRITTDAPGRADPAGTDDAVWIVPGLVDIHCHGGGGYSFDAGPAAARMAAEHHLRHGVTSIVASLVSASHHDLVRQVGELSELVGAGPVAGVHLEGPYLAERHRGAHEPQHLRDPSCAELTELLDAGGGAVRVVTLAPERPGAAEAIDLLVERGVVVAVGHTDATAAQTRAALARGATLATHLFNAMPGLHHREGGPVLAVAEHPTVRAELIADGHHISPDMVAAAFRLLGGRAVLVSDASSAAGAPDGDYHLGGLAVHLADGAVRSREGGQLAGSAITLLDAVRFVVGLGVPVVDAVRAATSTPSATLGLPGCGELREGAPADLVVLDAGFRVVRVMRGGHWVR